MLSSWNMLKSSFTEDSKCKFFSIKFAQVHYRKIFTLTFYLISNETLVWTMWTRVSIDCSIHQFEQVQGDNLLVSPVGQTSLEVNNKDTKTKSMDVILVFLLLTLKNYLSFWEVSATLFSKNFS